VPHPEALPKDPPTEILRRDRRRARRASPGRLLRCRVRTGRGEALGATVLDVSPLGAGLLLRGGARAGDCLVVEFCPEGKRPPLAVPALVTYCGAVEGGRAVVGCDFNRPLTHAQVADLLR
jgi:hypothetical protein